MAAIVVIDADERSRQRMMTLLESAGYRPVVADMDTAKEHSADTTIATAFLRISAINEMEATRLVRVIAGRYSRIIAYGDLTFNEAKARRWFSLVQGYVPPSVDRAIMRTTLARILNAAPGSLSGIVAASASMRDILQWLTQVAPSDLPVLLVGETGTGKEVLRQLKREWLATQAAVVSQDTFLFRASVRDNLLFSMPSATQRELEEATRAAQAHEFIVGLPHAYETVIGERGATLSGGQKQRLAIARALLRQAPILLLDEATSHVDVASESCIQAAIEGLRGSRTIIVAAHRLSTVRHADRILVVHEGRILEAGSHDALMAREGAYERMVRQQAPHNAGELVNVV